MLSSTIDGLICFSAPDSPETIELEINTVSEDGLILWQGVVCLYTWAPYWNLGHMHSGSKINNIYWPKVFFSGHEIALYIYIYNIQFYKKAPIFTSNFRPCIGRVQILNI